MKYFIIAAFFSLSFSAIAQSAFDNYKYIVVPSKFDNFKKENQYQTSTLVKHLLVQKGFTVVYENAMPEELTFNRCLGLYLNLNENSSMFSTKVNIAFKDCTSKEVFVTGEGKSKEKEFKKAYTEAITEALKSLDGTNYAYSEKQISEPLTVSYKNDVKNISDKKIINEKKVKTAVQTKNAVITQKATQEEQSYKSKEPVPSNYKKKETVIANTPDAKSTQILYAQEIANGFQLIDSTPKIRLKIFKTSVPDVYTVKHERDNGVVLKKEGVWYYEYYTSGTLVSEKLNIKF